MDASELVEKLLKFRELGIIGKVRRAISFTDEPKFPQWFCEPSNDRKEILEEQYGSSLWLDDSTAKIKCIAEAIERFCSETIDKSRIVYGSYNSLENALDPAQFINYSNDQLLGEKERYLDKTRSAKISWIQCMDIRSHGNMLVPAQLVYSPYDLSNEPIIRTPISTGAAFGTDLDSTVERGLLEIIERDSFMITWLTKRECPQIYLSSDDQLRDIQEYFRRYLLEPYVLDITADLSVSSMMGMLIDLTGVGPAVSVGLKSNLNAKEAALGALLEAQHVRGWIRFSYVKDNQPVIDSPEKIKDLKSRGYYWYGTEKIKDLDFLLKTNKTKKLCEVVDPRKELLVPSFLKLGFDVYTVDLSTPQVKQEGFYVNKTISPQLHPISLDEDLPYDYSARLERYRAGELNREPHPFL